MNTREAISATLATSSMVLKSYVGDLSNEELMIRPAEGCNHLAWQLGHLVASECMLLNMVVPGAAAELPEGFAEKHSKETVSDDNPENFCSKQEYLDLFETVHAATLAALEKCSDEDFDRSGPEHFAQMFPTVGHVFVLIATHGLMHAGQFVPVRRKLGKPIVI
ncbi:MAG: DinB family protein [Planctomycetota bacterium]